MALGETTVSREQLQAMVERLGQFGADNRAGIERTLHRISAIRNRRAEVVGLTCRVGRAVFGTVAIVRDLLDRGDSLLLMGRPGVGVRAGARSFPSLAPRVVCCYPRTSAEEDWARST